MDIGNNIRRFRRVADVTQEQLGKHIGVTKQMISLYESGTNTVSQQKLEQIAKFLGTTVKKLKEGKQTNGSIA